MTGVVALLLCVGAIALARRVPSLWFVGAVAQSVLVGLLALTAWIGMLFTGVVGLGWLTRWLGTPKLQHPWDVIAFLGPSIVAGLAWFLFLVSHPDQVRR